MKFVWASTFWKLPTQLDGHDFDQSYTLWKSCFQRSCILLCAATNVLYPSMSLYKKQSMHLKMLWYVTEKCLNFILGPCGMILEKETMFCLLFLISVCGWHAYLTCQPCYPLLFSILITLFLTSLGLWFWSFDSEGT